MGVREYTEEFTFPVAPSRLFKAIFTDAQNTIPKILPQYVKSVELESGACITKTTYIQGAPVRHRIDSFDSKNLRCKYTLIQGGMVDEKFLESATYYVRFEPAMNNNGCVIKATCEYRTKTGTEVVVNNVMEEDIKECKEMAGAVTKAVADYLIQNPTLCSY